MTDNPNPEPGPAGSDRRRRAPNPDRRAIYSADTWHVDDGTASDGSGRPNYHKTGIRRIFPPEYKLAILAEYDACSEAGEKGAILRREGLYSSLITDWRRQHRQGLLKAALGRQDGGRGGPSLSEVAKLRAENDRLRTKLAQAEAVIDVQGKVHALLEEISKSATPEE
ncbi:MAG TPA: transposase [Acidimicrobiales bacterium]|nr:transposase [Acidimicrobiales bacterium]